MQMEECLILFFFHFIYRGKTTSKPEKTVQVGKCFWGEILIHFDQLHQKKKVHVKEKIPAIL